MSEILEVSGDWLALREPEDAAARSLDLALAAADLLADGPLVVHDLGSGTGSMMRWLAPVLPGPQTWFLHDWSANLTAQAISQVLPSDRDNAHISVFGRTGNLGDLSPDDLGGASLVTASALLDVLTAEEIDAVVAACVATRVPVLLSLSVTGGVKLAPQDEHDAAFEGAFNAHQVRNAHGRQQSGRHAPTMVSELFTAAGWDVRQSSTVWQLDHRQPSLLSEWFSGWVDAAVEAQPDLRSEADRYRQIRLNQIELGTLSARVEHMDVLAWPRP
ncbi:SAM-dependent methyltransferase [Cryobacterium sp. CG_9.6]|uniref:SAM-dependent methyltransferase n=1 Tax=Cryobacterium sp. CG_9.6 TaxID=2760710 RepID=UPI002475A700|nr:SAM-dependent methyltransferase [Cryobacterium sp. CG_9.6]MDH6237091.1 hypothetical protein [Cryobacterium sp. CG_9.6]